MAPKVNKVEPGKARKRSNKESVQKNIERKKKLYSAPGLPKKPPCMHNSKTLQCLLLSSRDLFNFHQLLYSNVTKIGQDNYIIKYTTATKVKRLRPRKNAKNPRAFVVKYYIPTKNTKTLIPVCKKTFLRASRLNSSRIEGVIKRHYNTGGIAKENRGGDRKKFEFSSKAEAVENFIKSFTPLESHYCREQVKVRQYLHPELNIKKMFVMYNDQALPGYGVKQGFFRKIFNTRFNIGFGSPRTDVCSFCLQMTEKIKFERNATTKQELITQHRIHKLRAKQFFKMLKEDTSGLLIISFDCEKNLPLPKVPDQATYYSRQLYLYNFTIVIGSSKSSLSPQNTRAYVWMEDQAAKGSNEICSALYHCLNEIDLTGINKIRLVSDGCGGQNKNSMVVLMIMKWLIETKSGIKDVEVVFPVTGHSFLPADRVFALNERVIKKRENIIEPTEYKKIIEQHATIHELATEVTIYDWKEKSKEFLKSTNSWHFQISKCKRIVFKRNNGKIKVRGEISYRNDICESKSLLKRGKQLNTMILNSIPVGVPVKAAKLNDVNNLLKKHYGDDWQELENLAYYKNALTRSNNSSDSDCESVVDLGNIENEEIVDFV